MGFELNYVKLADPRRRARPRPYSMRQCDQMLAERQENNEIKHRLGLDENANDGALKDYVGRMVGTPYHKVPRADYEEFIKCGFRVEADQFDYKKMSEEEKDWLMNLAVGSAHRK